MNFSDTQKCIVDSTGLSNKPTPPPSPLPLSDNYSHHQTVKTGSFVCACVAKATQHRANQIKMWEGGGDEETAGKGEG